MAVWISEMFEYLNAIKFSLRFFLHLLLMYFMCLVDVKINLFFLNFGELAILYF